MKYLKVEDIEKYLLDCGELRSLEPLLPYPGKITHGSCCTCQTCGWDYDRCICSPNTNLATWKQFVQEKGVEIDGR